MHVIFDLDGCLSDDRRRRPLLTQGYDAYHSRLTDDPSANVDFVYEAFRRGDLIDFVTARPERWRADTIEWLAAHMPFLMLELGAPVIYMRHEGDLRGSVELKREVVTTFIGVQNVAAAYDDRADVVEMYRELGIEADVLTLPLDAADILQEMGQTFIERNAVYKDNYKRVAPVIKALWPEGVPSELVTEDRWHLFELMIVKLTRFATSGLTHEDSIHDTAVYAAMIETDLRSKNDARC